MKTCKIRLTTDSVTIIAENELIHTAPIIDDMVSSSVLESIMYLLMQGYEIIFV